MTVLNPSEDFIALDETNKLFKKINSPGSGPKASRLGSTVKVHYTGKLYEGGDVFDSSITRGEPIEFQLGKGRVIKGWDLGIASMSVGEKAELLIHSDYAYGEQGSPPKIKGGATLLFEVELLHVDESTADMTISEKISKAKSCKEDGNEQFKAGAYSKALDIYKNGADLLSNTWGADPTEGEQIKELKVSIYANLAAAALKINEATVAIEYCKKVLDIDEKHAKAAFRLYQANFQLKEYEEAIQVLNNNRKILSDVNVDNEILKIKKAKQAEDIAVKKVYSKMFA